MNAKAALLSVALSGLQGVSGVSAVQIVGIPLPVQNKENVTTAIMLKRTWAISALLLWNRIAGLTPPPPRFYSLYAWRKEGFPLIKRVKS